ncbi:MAG TPA: hypothetical protein VHX44_18190 [Planctomycetota bacterium]|nr:hypothetical protein [Planctomycetota bacterium]
MSTKRSSSSSDFKRTRAGVNARPAISDPYLAQSDRARDGRSHERITDAPTVDIHRSANNAQGVPAGVSAHPLTSDPFSVASNRHLAEHSLESIIEVKRRAIVQLHNAQILALVMRTLHTPIPTGVTSQDVIPQPGRSCIAFVRDTLSTTATLDYPEAVAGAARPPNIDPTTSRLAYYEKFSRKVHHLLAAIMQAEAGKSPLSPRGFDMTPKGHAQSELPRFIVAGTCAATPYATPLRQDMFSLQHSIFEFPHHVRNRDDQNRLCEIMCAAAGIDRPSSYIAVHNPDAGYYQDRRDPPHAPHCHIASTVIRSESTRFFNPLRHIGVRLTLCALDARCGNSFVIPRRRPLSYDAVMGDAYPVGYQNRRQNANLTRASTPSPADPQNLRKNPADGKVAHSLFDAEWIKNLVLPRDFVARYTSPDRSPVFSTGIFRTYRPGGPTQKQKVQADMNAADRFLAASNQLSTTPMKARQLPVHLLRRAAAILATDDKHVSPSDQLLKSCLGASAPAEVKAATLVHLSEALRQGKAESVRCHQYWTGT